jgi:hypothetical protein
VLDYHAKVDGHTSNTVIENLIKQIPFQGNATPKNLTPA